MNNITTTSNSSLPVGMIADYNNTNAARAINTYRLETSNNPLKVSSEGPFQTSFAQAIYADGPYSLDHPNTTSDTLCQNIDLIA